MNKEKNWEEIKKKLRFYALCIKGATNEEYPADLANLEDFVYRLIQSLKKEWERETAEIEKGYDIVWIKARQSLKDELVKWAEESRKFMQDPKINSRTKRDVHADNIRNLGYNQALDDLIKKLKE